ncbi:MAG: hypothetical protein ABI543_07870 [Ignavibacteria bacterium]
MAHENLFKIHIPDPCNEDWDKMTPNEQGSFCQVCSKTVVDFSKKSEIEIQSFLLENMDKKVCGRFRISQLGTAPLEEQKLKINIEEPKFTFPGFLIPVMTPFRATALALMLTASAMLSSCGNSGGAGGDDHKLTGAVEYLPDSLKNNMNENGDSVNTPQRDMNIQGGLSIKRVQELNYLSDTSKTCDVKEATTVGKIRVVQDTVKVDTTETMLKGEIAPQKKTMGIIKKTENK